MNAHPQSGIGEAWLALSVELQDRLRERDPGARVKATIAPTGLLELRVQTTPDQRSTALELARSYEETARRTCERCGGHVAFAGAGPVLTILCTRCSGEA